MTAQETTSVDSLNTNAAQDADKTRYAVKPSANAKTAGKTTLAAGMLIKQRYLLESKIGSGGMSCGCGNLSSIYSLMIFGSVKTKFLSIKTGVST